MAHPANPQRPPRWFTGVVLPFVIVLAASVALSYWWRTRSAQPPQQPPQVIELQPVPTTQPASPAPEPEPAAPPAVSASAVAVPATPTPAAAANALAQQPQRPAGVVPTLTVWVVHAGQDIAVSGDNIILPTGARFAVKVQSNVDGELAFFTINPDGVSSNQALWRSEVQAGRAVSGPGLRLQGTRGLETLRVIVRPANGGDQIEQHVQIWHQ